MLRPCSPALLGSPRRRGKGRGRLPLAASRPGHGPPELLSCGPLPLPLLPPHRSLSPLASWRWLCSRECWPSAGGSASSSGGPGALSQSRPARAVQACQCRLVAPSAAGPATPDAPLACCCAAHGRGAACSRGCIRSGASVQVLACVVYARPSLHRPIVAARGGPCAPPPRAAYLPS